MEQCLVENNFQHISIYPAQLSNMRTNLFQGMGGLKKYYFLIVFYLSQLLKTVYHPNKRVNHDEEKTWGIEKKQIEAKGFLRMMVNEEQKLE